MEVEAVCGSTPRKEVRSRAQEDFPGEEALVSLAPPRSWVTLAPSRVQPGRSIQATAGSVSFSAADLVLAPLASTWTAFAGSL